MHGTQEEKDELVCSLYTIGCDMRYGVSNSLLDKPYSDANRASKDWLSNSNAWEMRRESDKLYTGR